MSSAKREQVLSPCTPQGAAAAATAQTTGATTSSGGFVCVSARRAVSASSTPHHFQWWFRARIGMTRGLGHIDSAPLKVVAPMKGCRSRLVPCSRCALGTA
jgi:hypothetical protein